MLSGFSVHWNTEFRYSDLRKRLENCNVFKVVSEIKPSQPAVIFFSSKSQEVYDSMCSEK